MTDAELAAAYKRQRDGLLELMKNADVASGVCCCGDDMDRHTNEHSAKDSWDWAVECCERDINKFDEQAEIGKQITGE